MNISKEKKYIYKMMSQITDERRILAEERLRLSEVYFSLKERLEKLEDLELRGLDDLTIKGYVDLHNEQKNRQSLENLQREMMNVAKQLEEIKGNTETSKSVIPEFEISEQRYRDNNFKTRVATKQKLENLNTIDNPQSVEVAKKVEVVSPTPTENKQKRQRAKSHSKRIRNMIEEAVRDMNGKSFNAKSIYENLLRKQEFRDFDIPMKQFHGNHFYRFSKEDEHVEKIDSGTYVYNRT